MAALTLNNINPTVFGRTALPPDLRVSDNPSPDTPYQVDIGGEDSPHFIYTNHLSQGQQQIKDAIDRGQWDKLSPFTNRDLIRTVAPDKADKAIAELDKRATEARAHPYGGGAVFINTGKKDAEGGPVFRTVKGSDVGLPGGSHYESEADFAKARGSVGKQREQPTAKEAAKEHAADESVSGEIIGTSSTKGQLLIKTASGEQKWIDASDSEIKAAQAHLDANETVYTKAVEAGINPKDIASGKYQQDFERDNIRLTDGQYMSRSDFYALSKNYRDIAQNEGFGAYQKAVAKEQTEHDAALKAVAPYKTPPPSKEAYPHGAADFEYSEGYDLPGAVNGGVSQKALMLLFGQDVADKAVSQAAAFKALDSPRYNKGGGDYDIAAYLRDNPTGSDTIAAAGYSPKDIDQAKRFNHSFLGTDAKPFVTRGDYYVEYFKENGWGQFGINLPKATEAERQTFNDRLKQADAAYNKDYTPPMTQDQWIANYFADKGWQTINRGTEQDHSLIHQEDMRRNEATDVYLRKYGWDPVLQSAVGRAADILVPYAWVRNTESMTVPELVANAAVDTIFLLVVAGKPIKWVGGKVGKTIAGGAKVLAETPLRIEGGIATASLRDAYGEGGRVIAKAADKLSAAIARSDIEDTKIAATKLRQVGEAMKTKGIEGGDTIITRAQGIIDNAEYVQALKRTNMGATLQKATRDLARDITAKVDNFEVSQIAWKDRVVELSQETHPFQTDFYHGTKTKNVSSIRKTGFIEGDYFTTDINIARQYAGPEGSIVRVRLPKWSTKMLNDGGGVYEVKAGKAIAGKLAKAIKPAEEEGLRTLVGQRGSLPLEPPSKTITITTKEGRRIAIPATQKEAGATKKVLQQAYHPITAEEAKMFGLSSEDADTIGKRVGNDRAAFLREARNLNQARQAQLMEQIEADISRITPARHATKPNILPSLTQYMIEQQRGNPKAKISKDDWADLWTEAERIWAKQRRDIDAAKTQSNDWKIAQKAKAHEEYINRLAEITSAQIKAMTPNKSLASLNNQALTNAVIAQNPQLVISRYNAASGKAQQSLLTQLSPELAHAIQQGNVTEARVLAQSSTQSQTQAASQTQGAVKQASQTQALTKAAIQAKNALAQQPAASSQTKGATKAEAKPETKPQTKPATATATGVAQAAALATAVKSPQKAPEPRKVGRPPKEQKPPKPPPPILRLPGDKQDKGNRRRILKSKGAIAFRMGELTDRRGQKQDVWHVLTDPYESDADHITVIGRKPLGATIARGPDSAARTAQLLYGKHLSKKVSMDIGVVDATLVPISGSKGVALSFTGDPHLSTTSDISISKHSNIEGRDKVFPLGRMHHQGHG